MEERREGVESVLIRGREREGGHVLVLSVSHWGWLEVVADH